MKMYTQMILYYSTFLYFKYIKYKIVSTWLCLGSNSFAFVDVFIFLVISHIKLQKFSFNSGNSPGDGVVAIIPAYKDPEHS